MKNLRVQALTMYSAATLAIVAPATTYIVGFEGNELRTYQDIVNVWTGCGGITEGMGPNMQFTEAECREKNKAEVLKFAHGVDEAVTRPMTPAQHLAFTSFAYNVGLGNFRTSTLLKEFNKGNTQRACLELVYAGPDRQGWTKTGKKRNAGLTYRRLDEMDKCLQGTYK